VINFRYHLVSIIAIFLALALGIVIGTTALNGPITTDLRHQVNSLKSDRGALATQVKTLSARVSDADQFASVYGDRLLADTLTGQSVLILGMPGANGGIEDKIAHEIAAGGGKVSGRLEFTTDFTDQRRGADINALATGGVQPVGLTLPETSDPGQLGGALLAFVLLGNGQPSDLSQVLSGFAQLHMVSGAGSNVTPAKTVVVVGTGALPSGSYASHSELGLVSALQHAGGHVVVAGDANAATQAGLVAAVRGSGGPKTTVSTIDNADTAIGQVSTVLALVDVLHSTIGHYGTGSGARALFPTVPGR
jgi:Copper transport outer membrane protein, MctB